MELKLNCFDGKLIVPDDFFEMFDNIRTSEVKLPANFEIGKLSHTDSCFDSKISKIEKDLDKKKLDILDGCNYVHSKNSLISAYDESFAKYSALSGKVTYLAHSLVTLYNNQYIPITWLNLLFVTKSKKLHKSINGSFMPRKEEWDVDTETNVLIGERKKEFIKKYCFENSLLLIDGPFIGGDATMYTKDIKDTYIEKNIVSIYIVKNSSATMIIDEYEKLKNDYNSDLHYADTILRPGERTSFYKYVDRNSKDNTKVFCYIKFSDNSSPVRIELPTDVYDKNIQSIETFLNVIYYLIMVQGNTTNPQVRPIAIAEMYARETLKLLDFKKIMQYSLLTPSMNEKRGMDY